MGSFSPGPGNLSNPAELTSTRLPHLPHLPFPAPFVGRPAMHATNGAPHGADHMPWAAIQAVGTSSPWLPKAASNHLTGPVRHPVDPPSRHLHDQPVYHDTTTVAAQHGIGLSKRQQAAEPTIAEALAQEQAAAASAASRQPCADGAKLSNAHTNGSTTDHASCAHADQPAHANLSENGAAQHQKPAWIDNDHGHSQAVGEHTAMGTVGGQRHDRSHAAAANGQPHDRSASGSEAAANGGGTVEESAARASELVGRGSAKMAAEQKGSEEQQERRRRKQRLVQASEKVVPPLL